MLWPSIWSNLIENCTAMAQLSKVKSMGVELYNPSERFELNSKCSISTPDLSVGTRFSCYKGCRAVGTKINKILNCYLPLGGWDGTLLTFKFFIWLDLENVHVEEDSGKSEQHSFLCRVRQESDTGAQLWSSK